MLEYLIGLYITCSFITLLGFISGKISMHYKVDDSEIKNSFVIALSSVFFPIIWYKLYKWIKEMNRDAS